MKIAIVEDNLQDAELLKNYLQQYASENDEDYMIHHYLEAAGFLEEGDDFSLVIMDIDMPGINGIDAAKRMREQGKETVLMFVTNMPQYALQGYSVEAIDYVLKPISYQDFTMKMKKAERYIRQTLDRKLLLQTTAGMVRISARDILYVESSLHYVTFHMESGEEHRLRSKLKEIEEQLPSGSFVRCNASYLVNLRFAEAVEREDALVGGHRLKISRGYRKEFLKRLAQYLGGGIG